MFIGIINEYFSSLRIFWNSKRCIYKKGHYAVFCDLLQTENPGFHYIGDVLDIINDR